MENPVTSGVETPNLLTHTLVHLHHLNLPAGLRHEAQLGLDSPWVAWVLMWVAASGFRELENEMFGY